MKRFMVTPIFHALPAIIAALDEKPLETDAEIVASFSVPDSLEGRRPRPKPPAPAVTCAGGFPMSGRRPSTGSARTEAETVVVTNPVLDPVTFAMIVLPASEAVSLYVFAVAPRILMPDRYHW